LYSRALASRYCKLIPDEAVMELFKLLIIITMKQRFTQEYLHELKTKLKNKYPQLTDADLHHDDGMEEKMLRMVEYKLRKTKQELDNIISEL
jgi:hypothetical protein